MADEAQSFLSKLSDLSKDKPRRGGSNLETTNLADLFKPGIEAFRNVAEFGPGPRKPTPLQRAVGGEFPAERRARMPMLNAGFDLSRLFGVTDLDLTHEVSTPGMVGVTRGQYSPGAVSEPTRSLVQERLPGREDMLEDLLFVGASGNPLSREEDKFAVVAHEFRHKAFSDIREVDETGATFRVELPDVTVPKTINGTVFPIPLGDEDFVRLVGVFEETEDLGMTDRHFERAFGMDTAAILEQPGVAEAILKIQMAAAHHLEGLGIDTTVEFPRGLQALEPRTRPGREF